MAGQHAAFTGDLLFMGKVGGTQTEVDGRREWASLHCAEPRNRGRYIRKVSRRALRRAGGRPLPLGQDVGISIGRNWIDQKIYLMN